LSLLIALFDQIRFDVVKLKMTLCPCWLTLLHRQWQQAVIGDIYFFHIIKVKAILFTIGDIFIDDYRLISNNGLYPRQLHEIA